MTARTTIIQTPTGPVRLSAKGMAAFDALCRTGGDVKLAAAYLKQGAPSNVLCERQVRRIASKPGINAMIVAKARDTLSKNTARAADKLVSLMDQTDSKKVSLDAAQRILDVANIRPPQGPGANVNVNVGVMTPEGAAWKRRTNQIITTREDREEYERLSAQGAFEGGGLVGYILDFSEYDKGERRLGQPKEEQGGA
jgi:hypothetical protein